MTMLDKEGLGALEYDSLREANIARQAAWCPEQIPDLSFRGCELAGEVGEALNVIKKLERERLGWRGSRDTVEHLAEELADVVICTDLVAISAGIDLDAAVARKFNATSDKVGLPHKMRTAPFLSHAAGDVAGLVENAMEQAQVFASSYSLVGGRFDDGSQMQQANEAKEELRDMLAAALVAIQAENERMKGVVAAFVAANDDGPGLIDCIDNAGARYTSQYLCDTVAAARSTLAKEGGR